MLGGCWRVVDVRYWRRVCWRSVVMGCCSFGRKSVVFLLRRGFCLFCLSSCNISSSSSSLGRGWLSCFNLEVLLWLVLSCWLSLRNYIFLIWRLWIVWSVRVSICILLWWWLRVRRLIFGVCRIRVGMLRLCCRWCSIRIVRLFWWLSLCGRSNSIWFSSNFCSCSCSCSFSFNFSLILVYVKWVMWFRFGC